MRKYRLSIIVTAVCFILVFATFSLAKGFDISTFFKDKNSKIGAIDDDHLLVKGDAFNISFKEFIDYKENVKLVHQLNGIQFNQNDEELLQQMIDNRLLLDFAKKQGIIVDDEEVMNYALQTQKAFEGDISPEMKELHNHLANELGVSIKDYFTHPNTLEKYKETLMIQKAIDQFKLDDKEGSSQFGMGLICQQ